MGDVGEKQKAHSKKRGQKEDKRKETAKLEGVAKK